MQAMRQAEQAGSYVPFLKHCLVADLEMVEAEAW